MPSSLVPVNKVEENNPHQNACTGDHNQNEPDSGKIEILCFLPGILFSHSKSSVTDSGCSHGNGHQAIHSPFTDGEVGNPVSETA